MMIVITIMVVVIIIIIMVEVSHDSPSWHSFLDHIDHIILTGLRSTILSAFKILSDRVAQYEQVSHLLYLYYRIINSIHVCISK